MLKGLTNKMARFETESNNQRNPKSIGQKDPNKFRWPFNPQTLNRERRNEDPPIQPPIRPNEAIIVVAPDEEDIELTEGMNMLCDDNQMMHLFKNEYETILMEESSQNEVESKQIYFLRPRNTCEKKPLVPIPNKVSKLS